MEENKKNLGMKEELISSIVYLSNKINKFYEQDIYANLKTKLSENPDDITSIALFYYYNFLLKNYLVDITDFNLAQFKAKVESLTLDQRETLDQVKQSIKDQKIFNQPYYSKKYFENYCKKIALESYPNSVLATEYGYDYNDKLTSFNYSSLVEKATDMDLARVKARKRHEQWLKYQLAHKRFEEDPLTDEEKARRHQVYLKRREEFQKRREEMLKRRQNVANNLAEQLVDSGLSGLADPYNKIGKTPIDAPKIEEVESPVNEKPSKVERRRYVIRRKIEKQSK